MIDRRQILRYGLQCALALPFAFAHGQAASGPWPETALLEPAALNRMMEGRTPLEIFCVGFRSLYDAKHLPQARLAGPASKPDGVLALQQAVRALKPGAQVVLYCGCCPMVHCPNIRPAYRAVAGLDRGNVRVLNLPHNLHIDWIEKGYPAVST